MNDRPLYLHEYKPICKLTVERHPIRKPRFPVVDVHGHFADLYIPLYAERPEEWVPADVDALVAVLRQQGLRNIVNLDGFWDGFMRLDLQTVMVATRDYHDFFINFVSVDTTRIEEPDFAARVQRHLARACSLGFRGIKLFKHVSLMVEERPYIYRPGRGVRIDDPRLDVIWQTAARLDWPVLVHIADPECFFDPIDEHNERYLELLAHPDWAFAGSGTYSFAELMQAQENLLGNNPETTFIIPHVGSNAENLGFVSGLLRRHANLYVDLAARINELGRQYHTAHRFFMEHADRILFGTDAYSRTAARCYEPYYTYLETCDDAIGASSWTMTGQGLPDDVLEQIYWKNAARILRLSGC